MHKIYHFIYKLFHGVDEEAILISNKQFKKNLIDYHNYNKGLVKLLLSKYYIELKKIFEQKDHFICVKSFDGQCSIMDEVSSFIRKSEHLVMEGFLNNREIERFNYLKSLLSYDKALEQIKDTSFQYYYQQEYRETSVSKVFNWLLLEPEEFTKILTNNPNEQFDEELVIMFLTFINKYICVSYYLYPDNMQKNIELLKDLSNDYSVLDKIKLKEKPEFIKKAKLNPSFQDKIIKSIPEKFNNFEQAFYLYIKLCRTLSHDEIDLATIKKFIINHKDINRIQEIDEDNNIIVCYEFIVVLALFFDLIGVKYEIDGDSQFGRGHMSLKVLDGDALIHFEPTNGLYNSDLTKLKNNIKACGVVIEQANPNDVERISASMEKVYDYLEKEENQLYYLESELIKKFRARIDNLSNLTNEDKLKIFIEEISQLPYGNIVDVIKGMQIWDKVLFKHQNVFAISEILLKSKEENDPHNKVGVVIAFNSNGLDSDNKENFHYYLYTYPHLFMPISGDKIVDNFNKGTFQYLQFISDVIPGIISEEQKINEERRQIIFG